LQRIGIAYHNEFAPNQYFEIIPYFSNQFVDHPIFQTIRQENNNVGGEFRYVNSNSLFGKNNSFVMGFQPRYGNQRQQRFVNINGSIGAMTQNYTAKTTYFGMYAEDAFDATKDFTIVIGGRWDYTGRQATVDNFGPAGNPFNPNTPSTPTGTNRPLQHFDAISPKIGFVYRTTPTSQLYFNASRAYEAPLNLELLSSVNANGTPNTGFFNLDAQRAWQLELGHRGTSADKRYTWDVTVYNLEMQKEILASNHQQPGHVPECQRHEAHRRGSRRRHGPEERPLRARRSRQGRQPADAEWPTPGRASSSPTTFAPAARWDRMF
jgi:iron complex outermembrane receptor protein